MSLRDKFPEFFRLARDLRAIKFDWAAANNRTPKPVMVPKVNADGSGVLHLDGTPLMVPAKTKTGETVYEEEPSLVLQDDVPLDESNLVTSRHRYGRTRHEGKGMHRVVLDLDMDAALIPSSTPGHYHLIIDKVMSWPEYEKLLIVLGEVGIIENGYADASINKGYTAIRPPWEKKKQGEEIAWNPLTPDQLNALPKVTLTPWPKPETSSKPDGAKANSTQTQLEKLQKALPPTGNPPVSWEPSPW